MHFDFGHAGLFDKHINLCRSGVAGVLNQFLENRRRPFNHLTGGDLVHQPLR